MLNSMHNVLVTASLINMRFFHERPGYDSLFIGNWDDHPLLLCMDGSVVRKS